ncbi:MAG: hypothetical protein HY254_08270 [Burkholderiales bacterium]|nr:hypothetical protein [Burkholderiales bacterium]
MRLRNTVTLFTLEVSDDHEQIITELGQILKLLSLAHKKIAQTNLLLRYFERTEGGDGKIVVIREEIIGVIWFGHAKRSQEIGLVGAVHQASR